MPRLDNNTARPLTRDAFIRRVLVPEVALELVSEDLGIPAANPRARQMMEDSRAYGLAMFSDANAENVQVQIQAPPPPIPVIPALASSPDAPTKSSHKYLERLPIELRPFITSVLTRLHWVTVDTLR